MRLLAHESSQSNLTLCFLESSFDLHLPSKAEQGVVIKCRWKTGIIIIIDKAKTSVSDFSIECPGKLYFGYGISESITRRLLRGNVPEDDFFISMEQSLMDFVRNELAVNYHADGFSQYCSMFLDDELSSLPK